MRRSTQAVQVGNLQIGGNAPISIQSMTTSYTADTHQTLEQIKRLTDAGCEIIRVAVPDMASAKAISSLKQVALVPLVADIHFDYQLAIAAIEAGIDKVRLNPGNIGSVDRVNEVVSALKSRMIPLRIGVNSGSVEKELLDRYGGPTPQAMVESALKHVSWVERFGYDQIVISIKSSSVPEMVEAYQLMAKKVPYPLHLGVTEAGTLMHSSVKSAMGIGTLLMQGVGDTIRVSVTGDPVQEIDVAKAILNASGARKMGVEVISCPTCGRCQIDLEPLVLEVESALKHIKTPLTIALMGCAVNGPGEAREADLGIAGGKNEALLFRKGIVVKKVAYAFLKEAILAEVADIIGGIND